MLLLGLLFGVMRDLIAGDMESAQFSALLLAFYAIIILWSIFSFRYLEITSVDDDQSLLIRFGPLLFCCCCQRITIKNSNIKSYGFRKCEIWHRRGAMMGCCSNTLYLNGAGYPKCYDLCCDVISDSDTCNWCCDRCCCDEDCDAMCIEQDVVELKLKEKRKCCWYFDIETVQASTTDKEGLLKYLRSFKGETKQ